jgi:hypothetical protein
MLKYCLLKSEECDKLGLHSLSDIWIHCGNLFKFSALDRDRLDALRGKYRQTKKPETEESKYQAFAKQIRRQFNRNPNSIKQLCLSQKPILYAQGVQMSDNIKKILNALLVEAKKYSIIPSSHESEYLGETGAPPKEKQQLYGILMHLRDIDVFIEVAKIVTPRLYEVMKPILSSRPVTTMRHGASNIPGWVDKQLSKAYRPDQPMLHFDTGYKGSIPNYMFSKGAPETPVKLISANEPSMQLDWRKDNGVDFVSMMEDQTPHMMLPLTYDDDDILESIGKYGNNILGFYAVVFGAIDGIKNEVDEKLYNETINNQRTTACESPKTAYEYAKNVDKGPNDETRTAACNNPHYAYWYTLDIDKGPTDETRTAVCKDPKYAYMYAKDVEGPTDETRTAACQDPDYAYKYARDIDERPTDETRTAACKDPEYAYWYARDVDKVSTDETRTASCKEPLYAYFYALYVEGPTDETRTAACKDPLYAYWYARDVDKGPTDETKIAVSKVQDYAILYDEVFKTL